MKFFEDKCEIFSHANMKYIERQIWNIFKTNIKCIQGSFLHPFSLFYGSQVLSFLPLLFWSANSKGEQKSSFFLDAIAYSSSYSCQWVSKWVGRSVSQSVKVSEIAIASQSCFFLCQNALSMFNSIYDSFSGFMRIRPG